MKICFFSGDITRNGGTERVSAMIANGLAQSEAYEIVFLSLTEQSGQPFFALDGRIAHYALGEKWLNPGPKYIGVIPKLRRFFKQYQITIVIDIDIVLDILSIPAAKGLPIKIVSWDHFNFAYEMGSLYRRYILKYSVKRTDHIVTLTEISRENYRKELKRKQNISVIYNPMQDIACDDTVERENDLITVGWLSKIKGMDYLGRVAAVVLKRHPNWRWLVVGEGEERAYLQHVIEENELQGRLILTGRTEEVGRYLNKARIYVMTSRTEGLPMCLIEAKTFRLPIVSFDIPGLDEIVQEGINGYLVKDFDCMDMAEKLERLMEDDKLREQFAQNAVNNLSKFQMEPILRKWKELLDTL
ncbi:MAG: glycosyltransferase family 4 protein [Candidatus Gastranaerophilales bacterium]|nr:glycosyltransferase family 4 protein [Candidatus Gastranaerophilales bacterium]